MESRPELEKPQLNSEQFPSVDRQRCLLGVPQAGSDLTDEMGAPTHVRGVGPEV